MVSVMVWCLVWCGKSMLSMHDVVWCDVVWCGESHGIFDTVRRIILCRYIMVRCGIVSLFH